MSQREELSVEFDPEIAELLLVGMVVTGTYNLLSDGTWCFTQARHDPWRAVLQGVLEHLPPSTQLVCMFFAAGQELANYVATATPAVISRSACVRMTCWVGQHAILPAGWIRVAFVSLHGGLPLPSAAVAVAAEARVVAGPRRSIALTQRLPAPPPPPPIVTGRRPVWGDDRRLRGLLRLQLHTCRMAIQNGTPVCEIQRKCTFVSLDSLAAIAVGRNDQQHKGS